MFCMPMKPRALIATVFISAIVVAPSMVLAQTTDARGCGMGRGTFSTSSSNHSKIDILVEEPAASAAIFVVANKLAVNTDGSPRSYHLSDPKGERYALN